MTSWNWFATGLVERRHGVMWAVWGCGVSI
jgi:hypothetical protein